MVGEASSGKSSGLASMRRLLGSIEGQRWVHDDVRVVVADTALETIAETVSVNPRGVILWRDEPAWLAQLGTPERTAAIAPVAGGLECR